MSHDHPHNNSLTLAFWLNATFTVIEFAGGIYANSNAILADAIHDLGDTFAIGFGVWMEKYSKKREDSKYHFGYKRFSVLSAFLLSVFLIISSLFMLYHSFFAFLEAPEVKSEAMIYLAVIGVIVNGIGYYKIWKDKKSHGQNSKIVMLHLLEDVLGWLAVLTGGIIIYFTDYFWIDPLLTCLISVFILWRSVPNMLQTSHIFLQRAPFIPYNEIRTEILKISVVKEIISLKIWTLDGSSHVANIVIQLNETNLPNLSEIQEEIRKTLSEFKVFNSTIEVTF